MNIATTCQELKVAIVEGKDRVGDVDRAGGAHHQDVSSIAGKIAALNSDVARVPSNGDDSSSCLEDDVGKPNGHRIYK